MGITRPSWPKGPAQLKPGRGPGKPELRALTQGGPQLPQTFPQLPNPQVTQTWMSSLCLAWGHTRTLMSPCWGFRGSRKGPGQLEHAVPSALPVTHPPKLTPGSVHTFPAAWGARHPPSHGSPLPKTALLPFEGQLSAPSTPTSPHTLVRLLSTPAFNHASLSQEAACSPPGQP